MSFDNSAWKDSVVKDYLTATSQQKDDPEKFYRTHLDIDRIHAEFLGPVQDQFVTQERIRDEILDGSIDEDIRTYILRGETGSGKSQLCQWLDYELQGIGEASETEERIPLHIKASETSLEQIIATLAEPLGIDPAVSQVTELSAERVAEAIVTNIAANPGQALRESNVEEIIENGGLQSILEKNIERYQRGLSEEDETEFNPNLISAEDYRSIRLKLGTESIFHQNEETLSQALRDEIHRHFSHLIGVEDFQGQLREYVEKYSTEMGARPVIICEDVTTFSVLKEQLLDQIIQVESSSFDIVLGYTTGFEQNDLQDALGDRGDQDALTYLQDRAEGYLSLTENGIAFFLDDSLAVELVEKYLDVIKDKSGSQVDDAIEAGFNELYPFNRVSIQLAYSRLVEKGSQRRTPRVLLQKVVRRCLLSEKPPYQVIGESTNVKSPVTPIDPPRYNHELKTLATWYGYEKPEEVDGQDAILINTKVLETFGFGTEVGEGTYDEKDTGEQYVEFVPNTEVSGILGGDVSRPTLGQETSPGGSGVSPGKLGGSSGDNGGTSGTGTSGKPDTGGGQTPEDIGGGTIGDSGETEEGEKGGNNDGTEGRVKEFLDWVDTGGKYESSGVLRSGAETVLETWYDPTRLANPNAITTGTNGIYYTHGSNVPVSIQGPNERDGLSVTVEFGMDDYDRKFDTLRVGLEDDFPTEVNVEQLRSWATDSVVGFRNEVRENVEECLPAGMSIEHFIVLSKYLFVNFDFGETEFERDVLFDERTPNDARSYDNPFRSILGDDHGITELLLDDVAYHRDRVDKLVQGFFLLKGSLTDHERLRSVYREVADDPVRYLDLAQQIDTEQLDNPDWYRIGSNRGNAKTKVTTLLDAISDYAIELDYLTDKELREQFEGDVEAVRKWHSKSHTVHSLAKQYETLQSALGTFGITEKQSWDDAHELLTSEDNWLGLDEFNKSLESFTNPDCETPFERVALIHEFQRSREEHDAWVIYRAFDEMISSLQDVDVDGSGDLKDRLEELPTLRSYQQNRAAVIKATEKY